MTLEPLDSSGFFIEYIIGTVYHNFSHIPVIHQLLQHIKLTQRVEYGALKLRSILIVIGLSRASLETTLPIKSHISSSLSSLDKSISESIISLILCPKSSSTRNTPSHVSYDISKLIPLPQLYKLITCRYRCRDDRRLNQLNPLNYIA